MNLRGLLKNFFIDAYHELTSINELPRPPYDSPLIAGNVIFTHPLSKLNSHTQLQQYMHSSGLSNKLRDIGHTWFWHYEVFEWLFLECVIAESSGTSLDIKAFDKVFRRASAEISRNSFHMRRITILNGLPKLSSTIELCKGVLLTPVSSSGYDLARLLGSRFHNRNREPSLWVDSDNCLLIQDRLLSKGNHGSKLLQLGEQLRTEADVVIKTLKLSLDTPICPKAVYSSYLSRFPLLPISHTEFEEYSEISFSVQRPLTKAEILDIHRTFEFIQEKKEPEYFETALSRFADSYRVRQVEQNIVDLIVALEAMLGVRVEELRRRLATNVAFLLGKNDGERQRFYRQVSAGYRLRNTIVHGGRDETREMSNALKEFFPELKSKTQSAVVPYIVKAVEELQNVVRFVLKAYIYMRHNGTRKEWPNVDDLEYLPFDSTKRRLIQKQLGITSKQPTSPSWHF